MSRVYGEFKNENKRRPRFLQGANAAGNSKSQESKTYHSQCVFRKVKYLPSLAQEISFSSTHLCLFYIHSLVLL